MISDLFAAGSACAWLTLLLEALPRCMASFRRAYSSSSHVRGVLGSIRFCGFPSISIDDETYGMLCSCPDPPPPPYTAIPLVLKRDAITEGSSIDCGPDGGVAGTTGC